MMNSKITGLPKRYANYGFKGMVENKNNKKLIEFCKKYFLNPDKSLVMGGKVGTGKTRLAVAILRNIKAIEKEITILRDSYGVTKTIKGREPASCFFIVADEFFQNCNDRITKGLSKEDYIKQILSYDLICLDDLGIENFTPAKQENLYLLINRAYLDEKTIIITTNFTMEELYLIDPRITDRLKEMSYILKFEGDSFR